MNVVAASTLPQLILLIAIPAIKAEESLSWFTKDAEIKRSIFVPGNQLGPADVLGEMFLFLILSLVSFVGI